MLEFNTCKIGLEFEFGTVQGRHMTLEIFHDECSTIVSPGHDNKTRIEFDIALPTQILLQFKGKDPNHDTIVDDQGNITADVFVKIVKIDLDGFELNETFMHKKIKLCTDDGREIVSSYIGFNGTVYFDLIESDVFKQYLCCNFYTSAEHQ